MRTPIRYEAFINDVKIDEDTDKDELDKRMAGRDYELAIIYPSRFNTLATFNQYTPRKRLTDKDIERGIEMHIRGKSWAAIGRELKVSRYTIRMAALKFDYTTNGFINDSDKGRHTEVRSQTG